MFGNVEWFKANPARLPIPGQIKGWLFYCFWLLAVLVPTIAMLMRTQFIESGIWFLISTATCVFDVSAVSRQIRRKIEMDQLFYIGEEDSHVSTSNYELNLREPRHES